MRTDKENIRAYLLTQIGRGEKKYASKTVEAFGIAKATVYTYVKELEAEGIIRKTGNREYALTETRYSFRYQTADHPDESRLLRRDITPLMRSLPQNVTDIWDYAVSEMLNNAIDHADAENIRLTVTMDALNTTVSITDDGIGIFRHIHDYILRETGEDLLPEECASLLLAGKFTTARDRHSGEGIFFTSHMMDRFVIVSGGTRFERDNFADTQSWIPSTGFPAWTRDSIGHRSPCYTCSRAVSLYPAPKRGGSDRSSGSSARRRWISPGCARSGRRLSTSCLSSGKRIIRISS